jgi:ASC-1-like (ASCH) protein
VRITAVRVYNGFKEVLDKENPALLAHGMSKEQALSEYQNIYPPWKVKKFGGVRVFASDII